MRIVRTSLLTVLFAKRAGVLRSSSERLTHPLNHEGGQHVPASSCNAFALHLLLRVPLLCICYVG